MYFIGGDHYNNGINHSDLQIYCHRVYAKLPYNLSDDDLRHRLYTDVFKWAYYTRNDLSLKTFLEECKKYNVVPIVNNNPTFLDPNISVIEYARRGKILDQIIYDAGFPLAYTSHMNEPGKRHSTQEYAQYCNTANSHIKHYKTIMGNDEYNMLDWNYLLDNCTSEILGVHPLSSLGYPPNWQMLINWATMATARGKKYMITEGGSWFKNYMTSEGWQVIKDMIIKAKDLGYLATLIVLLDMNEGSYNPKLGFRWFDKPFNTIQKTSDYWEGNKGDNFINLVNEQGQKYIKPIVEDDDMKLDNLQIGSKGNQVKWLQEILEVEYGYENTGGYDGSFGSITDSQVKSYQADMGITVDGIVGKATTFELIDNAGEHFKPDYWLTKLEIWMGFD